MSSESKIQWTDNTWNPWHGCTKVSTGCKYCYMYRDKERYGQDPETVLRSKSTFNDPLKWQDPKRVFTCSWSDFFVADADAWRDDAWEIIRKTPQHTYQILTKRPERIKDCLPDDWGDGYPNVWIGVSVENQEMANARIQLLLHTPAKVRFLSCEPLLGPLYIGNWLKGYSPDPLGTIRTIDWVIIGGESGNETGKYGYRPCKLGWILDIIFDCQDARTPVFVKQMGTHIAKEKGFKDRHGGNDKEWDKAFQARQFPKTLING